MHFGASETLGLDSLALWQQWWRCYDTYDTNKIWKLKYDIYDMSGIKISPRGSLRYLGKLRWFHMWFGVSGRLGIVVQVEFFGISSQLELECISWKELKPYISWKLYKFKEKIIKASFDNLRNLHMWRERASGWLVSCHSQFRGWKIPIQVGVWKGHSGISWRFNGFISYMCNLQGSSCTLQYQLVLSSIPSFLIIFSLYGLRHTWWAIDLFGEDSNALLFYFLM